MSDSNTSVLVTGATSGIGQAIARGFAEAGNAVLAVGVGAIPEAETDLSYAELDVRNGDAVKDLLTKLTGLKVLVNAAGIIKRDAEHDPEVFQQVIDINLTGTMRCCVARSIWRKPSSLPNPALLTRVSSSMF